MECVRLRVKDVDFGYSQVTVRDGKGEKDRRAVLPGSLVEPPGHHLERVRLPHEEDLRAGHGRVYLPYASGRKCHDAAAEWVWRWVFPSAKLSTDARSHVVRRHHASGDMLQTAVKRAAKAAGVEKRVSRHTLRHGYAIHLSEAGYDIRTVLELLGHTSVETTRIYTHVLNKGGRGVKSPLDGE